LVTWGTSRPGLQRRDHGLARVEAVEAEEFGRDQPIGGLHHPGFGIEHVEHVARFDPGALAHFKVVEIVARRDLHRARAERRIGVLVGHDGNAPAGEWQHDMLADHALVAFILGCTATAMSASMVSGRVVATTM
jgi:hypothetical protein